MHLDIHQMLLDLGESSAETVVTGMIGIFPSLELCVGVEGNFGWEWVTVRIAKLQGIDLSLVSVVRADLSCIHPWCQITCKP